jgi:hypothetical protein
MSVKRRADSLGDAAPVRVAAVQRGLDQGRVGHRPRGALDMRAVTAAHDDPPDPLGALAVGDDHQRERAQQGVERLAEAHLVVALRRDGHAARARALQDRRVVGRQLAVDADAVERALDRHPEQQVGGLRRERRVGLDEAQHRREGRLDHPRALGLRGQAHRAARQLDVERGALVVGVGGLDRLGERPRAVRRQLARCGQQPLDDLLTVELHADHARRRDRGPVDRRPARHAPRALHLRRGVEPGPPGRGVGVAGVGRDRAQGSRRSAPCA